MWPWDTCAERDLVASARSQGCPDIGSTCERMHLKTRWVNPLLEKNCSIGDRHLPRANESLAGVATMCLVDMLSLVLAKSSKSIN